MKTNQITQSLISKETGLNLDGLKRYLDENERMIKNEIQCGISPRKYQQYVNAANAAIKIVEGR